MVEAGAGRARVFFRHDMLDLEELTQGVRSRVQALGFELVDFRWGGAGSRPRLQARIDRLGGSEPGDGVTVDDCARASRALEAWLDEEAVVGPKYILEVSSPGIERPIRWPEHWQRYQGQDVHVRIPKRGRVRATIVDVVDDGNAVVLHPSGDPTDMTVRLHDVRDATLAVDWS